MSGYEYVGGIAGRFFQGAVMDGSYTMSELIENHGDGVHTWYGIAGAVHSGAVLLPGNYFCTLFPSAEIDGESLMSADQMDEILPEEFRNAFELTKELYPLSP